MPRFDRLCIRMRQKYIIDLRHTSNEMRVVNESTTQQGGCWCPMWPPKIFNSFCPSAFNPRRLLFCPARPLARVHFALRFSRATHQALNIRTTATYLSVLKGTEYLQPQKPKMLIVTGTQETNDTEYGARTPSHAIYLLGSCPKQQ